MLQRPLRAPEFASGIWLNGEMRLAALRGRAVLVDLWDYASPECLRSLPSVQRLAQRYAGVGLTTIGVHVPEYAFGREQRQVELALRELDIRYPVLLDNEFRTWNAYGARFLPTRLLIDHDGMIRYSGVAAGRVLEQAIQAALREIDPSLDLPPIRDDEPPADDYLDPTPELHGGMVEGALGNPEGYAGSAPVLYCLPQRRSGGAFYVSGAWQASHEFLAYRGTTEGIVQVPYQAVEVSAVLSPHHDAVERMLHPEAVAVEIWQDDQPIGEDRRGSDTTEDGRVLVDRPRVYNLIRNPGFEQHELTLRVHARGFTLYTFAFVGGARRKAM